MAIPLPFINSVSLKSNRLQLFREIVLHQNMATPDDNPTIGIILCDSKDETLVKYSVLKENEQLFASKYQRILPTEEELIAEIEREKRWIEEGK